MQAILTQNLSMYSDICIHTYTLTSLVEKKFYTTALGTSIEIIIWHLIFTIQNKYSWSLNNYTS